MTIEVKEENRTVSINVRIKPSEKRLLDEARAITKQRVTDFAREAIVEKTKKVRRKRHAT